MCVSPSCKKAVTLDLEHARLSVTLCRDLFLKKSTFTGAWSKDLNVPFWWPHFQPQHQLSHREQRG